ncbi:hypothetical protein ACHAWF_017528 [Thalassiosira exigua]
MGHPRRDALEYGVLATLAATMAASYGFMLAYSGGRAPDGSRRKLPKVELDEEVDFEKTWRAVKDAAREMMGGGGGGSAGGGGAGSAAPGAGSAGPAPNSSGDGGGPPKK